MKTDILKILAFVVLVCTGTSSNAQAKSNHGDSPNKSKMSYKVNIGKIVVPKESIVEFKKQVTATPEYLKTLPGYVSGDYYEMIDESGNLHMVSVVTWENENAYKAAQTQLKKHYEEIQFNRMEFTQRLNVKVEYGAYDLMVM